MTRLLLAMQVMHNKRSKLLNRSIKPHMVTCYLQLRERFCVRIVNIT